MGAGCGSIGRGISREELTFGYLDEKRGEIIEHLFFTLSRNEGRGIRVNVPRSGEAQVMSQVRTMLETYQPGRDQNAVSPQVPNP